MTSYRQAFRARRFVIVAAALVVTFLAIVAPPAPVSYSKPSTRLENLASPAYAKYQAKAVLGVPPLNTGGDATLQFKTIAFYMQSTAVGDVFAKQIDYTGHDYEMLGRLVAVKSDPQTGIFTVTGYGGTRKQAADNTNAFTSALRDYLSGLGTQATEQSLKQAQAFVDDLKGRIDDLGTRIAQLRATVTDAAQAAQDPRVIELQAERDALLATYTTAYQHLTTVSGGGTTVSTAGLAILQPAVARAATEQPPSLLYELWLRIVLGLVVGLALGAALALLLEHNARKIFGREAAEHAFGARVLVEVPRQRFTGTSRDVVVVTAPQSRAASAYRMLRVLLLSGPTTPHGDRAGSVPRHLRPAVAMAGAHDLPGSATTLVAADTVAGDGPDRPTVAMDPNPVDPSGNGSSAPPEQATGSSSDGTREAWGSRNLALVVAATANEPAHAAVVANLAATFAGSGRTTTVLRLGRPSARRDPGDGADAEAPGGTPTARDTPIAGVRVVEWEPVYGGASPSEAVNTLRENGVVLVDTSRVATAEFAEIAPVIDGVVVVCQYGRTTIEDAGRTADIVAWSRARLLGVVLAQVPAGPVERMTWGRRRRSPLTSRRGLGGPTSGRGQSHGTEEPDPPGDTQENPLGLFRSEGADQ